MNNISSVKMAVIASVLVSLGYGVPAEAALLVLSQSAEVNLASNSVLFQIEFNRAPDFFTTDEYDRQADSFQYFIDADGGFPIFRGTDTYYSNLEAIIRGEEIHLGGDVRIRNAWPPDPDMSVGWGGWGSIRDSVPYTLSGNVFSLFVPLQLIGDSDGKFSYRLGWYEYGGGEGGYIEAETVPEPATVFGSFMALGGLAAFQRKNKQLKGLRSRGR